MKVTREKVENSQAFITVEMESKEVEESLDIAYHHLVQTAKIPGFRRGKAPRNVLERYLGRQSLVEHAVDDMLPEAYDKALKEQQIEAVAPPKVEITQMEPLIFKAIVPLKPKVNLGDYKGIRVLPDPVPEVTEENIDKVIEDLRHRNATWEPAERPIEYNDLVTMDIWSNIEGKPYINRKGAQYPVLENSKAPLPGFVEQLIGMKREDEKEFKLKFPEDHQNKDYAGKEVSFKLRINEIKREVMPEVNPELAKQVSPELTDVTKLREWIASRLKAGLEEKTRAEYEEKVLGAAVGIAEFEYPPVLVEREVDHYIEHHLKGENQPLEDYLKKINKTEEEIRKELEPVAKKSVEQSLVIGKLVEEEKIEAGEAEIDAEIENTLKSSTGNAEQIRQMLSTPQARSAIKENIIGRKATQRLVEIAKGSEVK